MCLVQGRKEKGSADLCTMYLSKEIARLRADFDFASCSIDPSSVLLAFQGNSAWGRVGH